MISRIVFGLVVGLWLATAPAAPPPAGTDLSVTAADGFKIHATLYLPTAGDGPFPVAFMLPQMNHTQESYRKWLEPFLRERFAVVTVDLRGHGASVMKGDRRLEWMNFRESDFAGMPDDVRLLMKELKGRKNLDLPRTILIGASIGANTALQVAQSDKQVAGIVLLSPGENYRGLKTFDAAKTYKGRPALVAASKKDAQSYSASKSIAGFIGSSALLKTYEGSDHGTDIVEAHPEFLDEIVTWAKAVVGRAPDGKRGQAPPERSQSPFPAPG